MENFYNKVIFDVSQLIINKNYKRALTLGQYLFDKGFRTAQLVVMISYTKKVVNGPKETIKFLQQYMQSSKQFQDETDQKIVNSPLIQMALAEYHVQIFQRNEAFHNIEKLLNITHYQQQKSDKNHLYLLLQQMHFNYRPKSGNYELTTKNSQGMGIFQKEISDLIMQINHITESYLQQKTIFQKSVNTQISSWASKYVHYYIEYEQIKNKILNLLVDQIKQESQNKAIKRIKKKQNKFLRQNIHQKVQQNQKFLNQQENNTIIQKKLDNLNQKQRNSPTNKNKNQIFVPSKRIEQLQSLLVHVKSFILFLKNKLKNCGTSRIKDFIQKDEKMEEINKN